MHAVRTHAGLLCSTVLGAVSNAHATRKRTETISRLRIPESDQGKGIPKPQITAIMQQRTQTWAL